MRIRKILKKEVEETIITRIECDKCGKEPPTITTSGFVDWGNIDTGCNLYNYETNENIEIILCPECFKNILGQFIAKNYQ